MNDGTYGQLQRDHYPELVNVFVPFLGKKLIVAGMKYQDGAVSRALMTNPEWAALTPERRAELTVHPAYLDEGMP